MNWCLVLAPEKVYAEKDKRELYSVELEDWNPDTVVEAIKKVDHHMNKKEGS